MKCCDKSLACAVLSPLLSVSDIPGLKELLTSVRKGQARLATKKTDNLVRNNPGDFLQKC